MRDRMTDGDYAAMEAREQLSDARERIAQLEAELAEACRAVRRICPTCKLPYADAADALTCGHYSGGEHLCWGRNVCKKTATLTPKPPGRGYGSR